MLTVKSTKKSGLTLEHQGRNADQRIDILAGTEEKEFIKANLENLQYDVTGQKFYIVQTKGKKTSRTTLQRALWAALKGKKVPARISRPDKNDFRVDQFAAA